MLGLGDKIHTRLSVMQTSGDAGLMEGMNMTERTKAADLPDFDAASYLDSEEGHCGVPHRYSARERRGTSGFGVGRYRPCKRHE